MATNVKQRFGGYGRTAILSLLLVLFMVASIYSFIQWSRHSGHVEEYLLAAADQRVLAHRISKFATGAADGKVGSFTQMRDSRDRFAVLLELLKNGSVDEGLPPSPEAMQPAIQAVEATWLELRSHVDAIIDNQSAILSVNEVIITVDMVLPDLIEIYTEITNALVEAEADSTETYYATRQLFLAQRINSSRNNVLSGGVATALAVDQLAQDVDEMKIVINALVNGNTNLGVEAVEDHKVKKQLNEATVTLRRLEESIDLILGTIVDVLPALEAMGDISDSEVSRQAVDKNEVPYGSGASNVLEQTSDKLAQEVKNLIVEYPREAGQLRLGFLPIGPVLITALGLISLVLLVLLGISVVGRARYQEQFISAQYERNQDAIRLLLDEISDLADGDLSVEVSMTEDITGAIGDSINYAISAFREVVQSINDTSEDVSNSVEGAQDTIKRLSKASEQQRDKIVGANTTIGNVTTALMEMSDTATRSAGVAQNSVKIATKGGEAVRRTISGMNNIREQIQETSKRIKRLGESSQEIGNIVELIEDVADQNNILALNAAMQAAAAGEAGRGFAVLADDVQRLAERSANATKQIEVLVQAIQADTNEAVSSMEASTAEVVSGAGLAEDAGAALGEIEQISQEIAEIITQLADFAQQESTEAGRLNDTMSAIQEISDQTSEGTHRTESAIVGLTQKINQLRRSVAGFVLPEVIKPVESKKLERTLEDVENAHDVSSVSVVPAIGDGAAPSVESVVEADDEIIVQESVGT